MSKRQSDFLLKTGSTWSPQKEPVIAMHRLQAEAWSVAVAVQLSSCRTKAEGGRAEEEKDLPPPSPPHAAERKKMLETNGWSLR